VNSVTDRYPRVGEKFNQWSDKNPPLSQILDDVTLYWFTSSFPRAIFGYRQFFAPVPQFFHSDPKYYIKKPFGYSLFPEELAPVPVSLVKKVCSTSPAAIWDFADQFGRPATSFGIANTSLVVTLLLWRSRRSL